MFANTITHVHSNPGTYYATLVAFDNQNNAGTGLVTIVVQVNSSGQVYPQMVDTVYDMFVPQIRFDSPGDGGALLPGVLLPLTLLSRIEAPLASKMSALR